MNFTVDYEDTPTRTSIRTNDVNQSGDILIPISIFIGMVFTYQVVRLMVKCWKKRQVAKYPGRMTNGKLGKEQNGGENASKDSTNSPAGLYFDDGPIRVAKNVDYSDFYYGPATFGLDMDELIEKRRVMTGPIFTVQDTSDTESEAEPELGEGEENYNYEHVEMLTCL